MQAGAPRGRRRPPSITIVLADDHRLIRDGVKCLLHAQKDFMVIGETGDGLKVQSLVARLKPEVLIAAAGLPGLNGLEVARRVTPGTRVILLSRSPSERTLIEALRSGAAGFVTEHTKSEELIRAVRRVTAGHVYLSAPFSKHAVTTWLQRAERPEDDPYERLTGREREVLQLVAEGYSSAAIAGRLAISPRTAEAHRASVMRKLNLGSQADLIRYALARGILPPYSQGPWEKALRRRSSLN
jgi:DNA-binding NarL/FixJ family response regulator